MPDESTDPIEQAMTAINTAIGTDETVLRQRWGNDRYEAWEKRRDAVEAHDLARSAATVIAAAANAETAKAQSRYVTLKGTFWGMLSFAVFSATTCGIVEFVRWVVR